MSVGHEFRIETQCLFACEQVSFKGHMPRSWTVLYTQRAPEIRECINDCKYCGHQFFVRYFQKEDEVVVDLNTCKLDCGERAKHEDAVTDPSRIRNQPQQPYLTHAALWGTFVTPRLGTPVRTMCGKDVPNTTIQQVLGWKPTCPDCKLMDGHDGISLQPGGYKGPMTVASATDLRQRYVKLLEDATKIVDRNILAMVSQPVSGELRYNPTTDAFEGEGKTIPADTVGKTRAKLVSTYGMTRAEARAWTRNPGNWLEVSPGRSKIRLPTSTRTSQP